MKGSWAARLFGALSLSALAAAAVTGCGDDSNQSTSEAGGSSGSAGAGGSAGSAGSSGSAGASGGHGEKYAAAYCGNVFKCCVTADLDDLFGASTLGGQVTDYAGCRILYRTVWEAAIESIVAQGKAAGRLDFDEAAFTACMDSIANRSCGDLTISSALCDDVFIPKVPKGGACSQSLECTTHKCDVPSGASEGACVDKPAPVALGGTCTSDGDCDVDLFCGSGMCAAKLADGTACGDKDECKSGACVGAQQGAGTCKTICQGGGPGPGPIDAALESVGGPLITAECDKFFECCNAAELSDLLSGGITTAAECSAFLGSFFGLGLVQVHNSEVAGKLAVDGAALSSCVDQLTSLSCADFSKNNKAQIDCADAFKGLVADGQACSSNAECKSDYCNEPMPDQGTCAALPGAGAACTSKCVDGYYCETQKCVAQKKLGEPCTSNGDCAEGLCTGPVGGPEACAIICDGP